MFMAGLESCIFSSHGERFNRNLAFSLSVEPHYIMTPYSQPFEPLGRRVDQLVIAVPGIVAEILCWGAGVQARQWDRLYFSSRRTDL
jgi:hypothetical protein